jgi:phosphatidylglycerophosphatase A
MKFIVTLIGTFGFTGFFPFAPATFASFVFVLIYAYVPGGRLLAHPIAVLVTLLISVPVSTSLERRYGHDASRIVIDEVVGMQVILMLANPSMWGIVLAFFLFRFLTSSRCSRRIAHRGCPVGTGSCATISSLASIRGSY